MQVDPEDRPELGRVHAPQSNRFAGIRVEVWIALAFLAAALQLYSFRPNAGVFGMPITPLEAFGAITGVWGVLLVVRESVWNWPIGIVNSAVYVVVLARARLFGDAGLSVLYVILGVVGLYAWLRGGTGRTPLPMTRADPALLMRAILVGALLTWWFTIYLASVDDSAPFLDALTTSYSLVAQYLLTRKLLENWLFWIFVDVIYIPLFFSKSLPLTAGLYTIFLGLAIAGYLQWRRTLAR